MTALSATNVLALWSLAMLMNAVAVPRSVDIPNIAISRFPTVYFVAWPSAARRSRRRRAVGCAQTYLPVCASLSEAADAQVDSEPTQPRRGTEEPLYPAAAEATLAEPSSEPVTITTAAQTTAVSTREFRQFLEVRREERSRHRVVLDLRPVEDFRKEHLVGATSMPLPELEARMLELPPPYSVPVSIVGSDQALTTARKVLEEKGYRIDETIRPNSGVEQGRFGDSSTEAGSRSVQVWRPNDLLEFCVERYLVPSATTDCAADESLVCLDLGCGSGRDAVYMAQHLPPGTRVIGVDNHSYALERGKGLARTWLDGDHGVGGGTEADDRGDIVGRPGEVGVGSSEAKDEKQSNGSSRSSSGSSSGGSGCGSSGSGRSKSSGGRACEWLCKDLRKDGALEGLHASVIHGNRFKCEKLLPVLRDEVLLPGGYFIWSTFLDTGTENLVPPWRPSRMMRPGELADVFSGDEFEILLDEEGELSTRGSTVPANFFVCRRRPASPRD